MAGKNNRYEDLFMPKPLLSANLVTRKVFEKYVDRFRTIHGVEKAQAYKFMQECACASCPGNASGQPSSLHQCEKEIELGIEIAREKAKATDSVPDYSDLRSYSLHLFNFLQNKFEDLGSEGFGSHATRCALLGKVVGEHTDIVKVALVSEPDEKQLEEVEQLQAVLEDYAACLRGEIALNRRMAQVDANQRGRLKRA